MSRSRFRRALARSSGSPLPPGVRICRTCGDPRGVTPAGQVAACWCSGLVCNRCSGRERRPITDYYDVASGSWVHVPYFNLVGHRCLVPEGRPPGPKGWTRLPPDPEVIAYQEAVTRLALAEIRAGDTIEVVKMDQVVGVTRVPGDGTLN